jgi:chromosome segregation ATPase
LFVAPLFGSGAQVSPVQKVLQLIDEFTAKVTTEFDETKKVFEEFAQSCDNDSSEKTYAIKTSKEQLEDLAATITDCKAGIETETSKVSDASAAISETEKELNEANALRAKENADFLAAEKELLDTVDSLAGAQEQLKKSLALIQSSGRSVNEQDRQAVAAVAQSLGQIVEAAFVTTQQRSKIQAFFQEKEDADDALTFRTHSMGGGGSDAIIETLEEMEDKASDSLTKVRNEEMKGANAHAMLKQSLENEIKNGKKELAEATHLKQALTEKLAQAEKDSAMEKKGLSEDEAYLRDLKRSCQTRAQEFEVEAKDTDAELTALGKAKAILTKKFGGASFVELKATTRVQMRSEDGDVRAQALRLIQQVGQKYHSTALISLAYRAAADPFAKVRSMIEDMIAKLLQEAAEEANQKAMCDKEIGESKASQKDKEGKLGKINARLGEAESNSASLSEEIAKLSKEVAENDAAMSSATAQRNKEKAVFVKVEKDLSESEEACAAAISVLREYYEGASLIQLSSQTNSQTEDGGGIISVLEVAESDFANSLAEVRSVETRAVDEYDKMMQDSKLLKVTKEMEIKGKESEVKSLKTTISDNSEDKAGLSDELDAVLAYLDKLKPQCETKVPSYAEIKAKREAEIQGLKEALDILSAGPPAFFQTQLRGSSDRA